MSDLPSIYADPAHYDHLAKMTAPRDRAFWLRRARDAAGKVLELACGTGRVTLPLAAEGFSVTGIDSARPLLDHARAKADELCLGGASFVEADMREFDLGERFDLVIIPYNAFNHLFDLDDARRCLAAVKRHMGDGARFVIASFNPDPRLLHVVASEAKPIVQYLHPEHGKRVVMNEAGRYDPATQINHITWRYDVAGEAGARVDELRMRIYFPQELDALLQLSGFAIEAKYGAYDDAPFSSSSSKQLIVARTA